MLNKWSKKLNKEYVRAYSEEEQEFHAWHTDHETPETYTWRFDTPEGQRVWTLNKKSGIITRGNC